jgi:hypothetical protein
MHITVEVNVTSVDGIAAVYIHQEEVSTAIEVEKCLTEVGKIAGGITSNAFGV